MRIFYALKLPEQALDAVEESLSKLKPYLAKGKLCPRENLHITLSFVGEVSPHRIALLSDILHSVKHTPACTLTLSEPTTLQGASLICSKIKPDANLLQLNKNLTELLNSNGFTVQTRFTPHVTILRKPVFSLPFAQLKKQETFSPVTFTADTVVLFESTLGGEHPVYTPLDEIRLIKA